MKATSAAFDLDPAIEKKLLGALVIAVIIVAFMGGAVIQNNSRQAQSAAWVNHTHAFILETDAILSSLHAAEAAQRTYLLTGDEGMKQAAAENFAGVSEHLNIATKLAFENEDQLDRLGAISALLQTRIDVNKEALRLLAKSSAEAAGLFTNAQATANLRDIERQVFASRAAENRLLHERETTSRHYTQRTEDILWAGGALNVLLLSFAFYVVRIDLRLRRDATAILETKVRERTAELNSANNILEMENIEQKWGQAALQRIVNHHELVLNSIQEGIFVISRNGHIISANPAAANLARKEARQLAGKSIASLLFNGEDTPRPWDKHFLAEPVKAGKPMPLKEGRLKQADGSIVSVQIACHPTRDRENLTGAVITVTAQTHSPMQ
jgi:PAS domain S-box-containing protein